MKQYLIILLFLIYIPTLAFKYPLKATPNLSATFGEFRNGHYHAGLDLKTYGKINIPVYAINDGYITRIKVSPFGYGKVVYQKLANGKTAVYAHCNKFNKKLEKYLFQQQIKNKTFSIDLYFKPNQFPVKKGNIIAYSGRSGTIHPHLHFEIRNNKNQPINPLSQGFDNFFNDKNPPVIKKILISPLSANTKINFNTNNVTINNNKQLDTIYFNGKIGIKILTYDYPSKKTNKNNIYAKYLIINNDTIYKKTFDIIDFAENYKVDFENILNPLDKNIYQLLYDFNSNYGTINSKYLYKPVKLQIIVKDYYNNQTKYPLILVPITDFKNVNIKINNIKYDTVFYTMENKKNLKIDILSYNPITKKYNKIKTFNDSIFILNEKFIYTGQRIIIFNFKYKNFIVKRYQYKINFLKKFKFDTYNTEYKTKIEFFDNFIKLIIKSNNPITNNILQINNLTDIQGNITNLNTIEFNINYSYFSKIIQNNQFNFNNHIFYTYIIKTDKDDQMTYTYIDSLLHIKISKNNLIKENLIYIKTQDSLDIKELKQISKIYSIKPYNRFCKSPIKLIYSSDNINNKCGFYFITKTDISYKQTVINKNNLICNINKGGEIAILMDTISPEIKPLNFKTTIPKNKILKIQLSDIGSGIDYKTIKTTLNGNFVIPEYDGPKKILKIDLSKYKIKKRNKVKIKISDYNENTIQKIFYLIKRR